MHPTLFKASLFLVCLCLPCLSPAVAATWVPEQQVNLDDDYDDWSPKVVIDTTGRAWVVWGGVDPVEGDEEICFRWWDQGAWGPQGVVNPPNTVGDRFPELCSGKDDGVPWCVWAGWNSGLGAYDFLVSYWLGDAWSWPETVFVGGERYDTYDIVARDTSLVWVLWSARTTEPPTHKDVFARARVGGVWGEVEQIEIVVGHEGQVRADLDSEDQLWAVWQSDSLDCVVIQSCVRDESGWGEVVHVAPDYSATPAIAVDDDGVAWVVWIRGDMGSGSYVMSARWEAGGWRHLGEVNSVGGSGIGVRNPVIRNVPGSGPVVVWWGGPYSNGEARDIYESKWMAYGWREQGCVSTPDSVSVAYDAYPGLAVASEGRAWGCWMRAQRVPPYDYDIWCSYSDDVTPVHGIRGLKAEVRDGVVVLSWVVDYWGNFGVYRSDVLPPSPVSCVRTAAVGCDDVRDIIGEDVECLTGEPLRGNGGVEYRDCSVESGCGYEYWVVEERAGRCYFYGPVYAEVLTAPESHVRRVYPNPFVSGGWVVWSGSQGSDIEIYDLSGRLVRKISPEDGMSLSFGEHLTYWDGKDNEGRPVASGVYLVRISLGGGSVSPARKVVVIR